MPRGESGALLAEPPAKITFDCAACGKSITVGPAAAGKKGKCPGCKSVVRVPRGRAAFDEPPRAKPRAQAEPPRRDDPPRAASSEAPAERDFEHEAHLKGIAFWFVLAGVLGLLGLMVFLAKAPRLSLARDGLILLPVTAMAIGMAASGFGLWRYHSLSIGAVAVFAISFLMYRVVQVFFAASLWTGFSAIVAGTYLGCVIWAVFQERAARICSPQYREVVSQTRLQTVAWYKSPFFFVPWILTAVSLIVWVAFR